MVLAGKNGGNIRGIPKTMEKLDETSGK